MEAYKKEFIEFMVDCQVLKFGDFVTKSGRKTPFFVNTGFYRTGAQLRRLGQYYAEAINSKFGLDFDVLFGPAYKGIPLSVAATIAISEKYGQDIRYCSNRKEVKDHGDKGILLGSPINDGDKVVIIEDVTTAGTSIEETLPIIKAQGDVNPIGLVVSVEVNLLCRESGGQRCVDLSRGDNIGRKPFFLHDRVDSLEAECLSGKQRNRTVSKVPGHRFCVDPAFFANDVLVQDIQGGAVFFCQADRIDAADGQVSRFIDVQIVVQ